MGHMIENTIKTVTKIGTFNGKPFLAIHELKDDKESTQAVISFGLKKAKAILASVEEIKKFVESEG